VGLSGGAGIVRPGDYLPDRIHDQRHAAAVVDWVGNYRGRSAGVLVLLAFAKRSVSLRSDDFNQRRVSAFAGCQQAFAIKSISDRLSLFSPAKRQHIHRLLPNLIESFISS